MSDSEQHQSANAETEVSSEGADSTQRLLSINLPAHPAIIADARDILADRRARIDVLALCLAQDPVITLELLQAANTMFQNRKTQPIISTRPAIIRLGSAKLLDFLDEIENRRLTVSAETTYEIEHLRLLGRRASIVARFIAMSSAHHDLINEVETSALFQTIGYMIICAKLGDDYLRLAKDLKWSGLNYRLSANHKINARGTLRRYLLRHNFPERLTLGFERDGLSKNPELSNFCFILESALEILEAFDFGKWAKYHPNANIPNYSSLRLLQMNRTQYQQLYEACDKYLHLVKDELDKSEDETDPYARFAAPFRIEASDVLRREEHDEETADSENTQQSEKAEEVLTVGDLPIEHLTVAEDSNDTHAEELSSTPQTDVSNDSIPLPSPTETLLPKQPEIRKSKRRKIIFDSSDDSNSTTANGTKVIFDKTQVGATPLFNSFQSKEKPTFIVEEETENTALQYLSEESSHALEGIQSICNKVDSAEDLLFNLLETLISDGPFKRAALIIVNDERSAAKVYLGAGPGVVNNQTIVIDDPTSALASCNTQVKSFNTNSANDKTAPFGVSSYAISPLNVAIAQPVLLYADCGEDKSINFEARRTFRYMVGIVNKALKTLPGGLPEQPE